LAISVWCRQQRVRRHNRGDVPQETPSEYLGFCRQSTTLRVGEPQTSGPELFPQEAIFFLEIVDDIALLMVHPTREGDENEPQWVRQRVHGCQGYQRLGSSVVGSLGRQV